MEKSATLFIAILLGTTAMASSPGSPPNAKPMASAAPVKKVLLEEFTTCSCGNCPPASYIVNEWVDAHPNSIMMTIHEGSGVDGMSTATTGVLFDAFHPNGGWFAPALMINRGVHGNNREAYLGAVGFGESPKSDSSALRLLGEKAEVGVDILGTYNSTSRVIDAKVEVSFVSAVASADWRINLFLVEDSVIGTPHLGAHKGGYDQHVYDSKWANSHYPGKFDGTSIIGYPHRRVMRDALLGDWGAASVIPAVPTVGAKYSQTTTFTVPASYREKYLTLVAFVSMYTEIKSAATHTANIGKNYVLNANNARLAPVIATGIEKRVAKNNSTIDKVHRMSPAGETHIFYTLKKPGKAQIILSDVLGHSVRISSSVINASAGTNKIVFATNALSKGLYYITLNSSEGKAVKKLFIAD
jgi:hypothetical protein